MPALNVCPGSVFLGPFVGLVSLLQRLLWYCQISATAHLLLPADDAAVLGKVQEKQIRTAPSSGVQLAHAQEQQSRSRLHSDQVAVSRIPKPPTVPQAELMPPVSSQKLTGRMHSDQPQSSPSALADGPISPRNSTERQATSHISSSSSLLPRSNPTTEDSWANTSVAAGASKSASCSQGSVQGCQEQPASTAGQPTGLSRASAPDPQEAASPSARSDVSQGQPLSKAGQPTGLSRASAPVPQEATIPSARSEVSQGQPLSKASPMTSSSGFAIGAALRKVLNRTRIGSGSARSPGAPESWLRLRMNTTTQIPMPALPMDPPTSKLTPPAARVISPEPERPSAFTRQVSQPSKPLPHLERVTIPGELRRMPLLTSPAAYATIPANETSSAYGRRCGFLGWRGVELKASQRAIALANSGLGFRSLELGFSFGPQGLVPFRPTH